MSKAKEYNIQSVKFCESVRVGLTEATYTTSQQAKIEFLDSIGVIKVTDVKTGLETFVPLANVNHFVVKPTEAK